MTRYPWLQPVFDRISQDATADRLSHALLISGQQGVGVAEFAQLIAHFRLCFTPTDQGACGHCKACKLIQSGSHPDLRRIGPEGAAGIIKVDPIRDLVSFVGQTPQIGEWKVVLLTSAHRMNSNAANALLKILEEPAGKTLLLLATERPQLLLPTVRSRCAKLNLPNPTEKQCYDFLQQQGIEQQVAQTSLSALGCKPLKIVHWIENDLMASWQSVISQIQALEAGQSHAIDVANSLKDIQISLLIDWLIDYIGSRMRTFVQTAGQAEHPVNGYGQLFIQLLETKTSLDSGSNPNAQLVLESLFLDWAAMANNRA